MYYLNDIKMILIFFEYFLVSSHVINKCLLNLCVVRFIERFSVKPSSFMIILTKYLSCDSEMFRTVAQIKIIHAYYSA